jgi:hypothetical protein
VIVPALTAGLAIVPTARVRARWVDLESEKVAEPWVYCKVIVFHLVNQELVLGQFRNEAGELTLLLAFRDLSLRHIKRRF